MAFWDFSVSFTSNGEARKSTPPSIANSCLRANSRWYSAPNIKLESRVISRLGSGVAAGPMRLHQETKFGLVSQSTDYEADFVFFLCYGGGERPNKYHLIFSPPPC